MQVTVPQGATLRGQPHLQCLRRRQRDLPQAGCGPDQLGLRRRLPGRRWPPTRTPSFRRPCRASTTCLIEGNSEPADDTPVTVLARVAPAVDHERADRPGGRQPVRHHHDHRRPVPAQCDRQAGHARLRRVPAAHHRLRQRHRDHRRVRPDRAPYGLYDVQVTNPDGQEAIAPYRFEIEQVVEPDVTIGVGGPRFILAGDTGTYSVAAGEPGKHQRALRRVQRRHPAAEQRRAAD